MFSKIDFNKKLPLCKFPYIHRWRSYTITDKSFKTDFECLNNLDVLVKMKACTRCEQRIILDITVPEL